MLNLTEKQIQVVIENKIVETFKNDTYIPTTRTVKRFYNNMNINPSTFEINTVLENVKTRLI